MQVAVLFGTYESKPRNAWCSFHIDENNHIYIFHIFISQLKFNISDLWRRKHSPQHCETHHVAESRVLFDAFFACLEICGCLKKKQREHPQITKNIDPIHLAILLVTFLQNLTLSKVGMVTSKDRSPIESPGRWDIFLSTLEMYSTDISSYEGEMFFYFRVLRWNKLQVDRPIGLIVTHWDVFFAAFASQPAEEDPQEDGKDQDARPLRSQKCGKPTKIIKLLHPKCAEIPWKKRLKTKPFWRINWWFIYHLRRFI